MIEIIGKYNNALCYTDILEPDAYAQIKSVCDEEAFSESKIRIMPDVHAGKGCTIGTTMTVHDKVVPGMVGVDIGCGMESVRIAERDIDLEKLDRLIHENIPCGREIRSTPHAFESEIDLTELRCVGKVAIERARLSIGTLGGGNHFIEIDRDGEGNLYLVVHSGSRYLGNQVAKLYDKEGVRAMAQGGWAEIRKEIEKLRAEGREREIEFCVEKMKRAREGKIPRDLVYVEGKNFDDYIHDMKIIQRFADLNRRAMTEVIISGMGFTEVERFTTVHNYIDTDSMILRKGSVSAKAGEKLLIPINMRDGSLICIGRGNADWNYSAPHGAGRIMSRSAAFRKLSMEEYRAQMAGIYSTCVVPDTLDESPMAYKSMEEIVENIGPTAEIVCRIKPIYNFKAAE